MPIVMFSIKIFNLYLYFYNEGFIIDELIEFSILFFITNHSDNIIYHPKESTIEPGRPCNDMDQTQTFYIHDLSSNHCAISLAVLCFFLIVFLIFLLLTSSHFSSIIFSKVLYLRQFFKVCL